MWAGTLRCSSTAKACAGFIAGRAAMGLPTKEK